ncbi:SMI1/KNR4 family protein [Waterburya agarophytonicola K14]|uniref:SMI1/KNR4 family protein n=1 Tax=Waterburya agarophytonicola KI4 TaxID=2874699 RepID=A0A964BV50_9CYAN|nr:SMI1/KNR4 family protein [Waterburya agarophytonicola]MCC0178711.1 SMI1/KNR4 family protein [Waterburya agarophytonicola KI4]
MSLLTETLNKIFLYLKHNYPKIASSLQPGLSDREIELKVASLPFRLPQEFYELYQWKNGTPETSDALNFYRHFRFLPLEEALTTFPRKGRDSYLVDEYLPYGWIPIFTFEGEYYGVVGSQIQRYDSPIVYLYHEEAVGYTNLTSMMQAIAECYETKVYYLNKHNYIAADSTQEEQIVLKYNPIVNTPYFRQDYHYKTIEKSPRLKIINTYSCDRTRLIETRIDDYKNNIGKSIEYLGGKIIRMQTNRISNKSMYDSWCKYERFYTDRDAYEHEVVTKKIGWFRRETTQIQRWYIDETLKKEIITSNR